MAKIIKTGFWKESSRALKGELDLGSFVRNISGNIGGELYPTFFNYPEVNPSKENLRFWYNGNEWEYISQSRINSLSWQGYVEVGTPVPVYLYYNPQLLLEPAMDSTYVADTTLSKLSVDTTGNTIRYSINFFGIGYSASRTKRLVFTIGTGSIIDDIRGASVLASLVDSGTGYGAQPAIRVTGAGIVNSNILNKFFQELPVRISTVVPATINLFDLTLVGSGLDASIATSKNYTIILNS